MFYLYFVLALSLIVALHEFGHFLAARFFGVQVDAFSIGFGPVLCKKKVGETEFRLSLIPLGGYVKMLGENSRQATSDPKSFASKNWWQRVVIAFAGPFANLVVAFIFFSASFMVNSSYHDFLPIVGQDAQSFRSGDYILQADGKPIKSWSQIDATAKDFVVQRDGFPLNLTLDENFAAEPAIEPIVGEVSVGMPAYLLGLQEGDRILRLNGAEIISWSDIGKNLRGLQSVPIVFSRGDKILRREISPVQDPISGRFLLGISAAMTVFPEESSGFFASLAKGAASTVSAVWLNYYGLYKILLQPSTLKGSLSGPVMISQAAKSFSQKGLASILIFIAFVNVVLFVMNLLPIPILDGGLILFAVLEKILRRPLSDNLQTGLQYLGLFLLMSLMFFSFYNDADKLVDRLENSKSLREGVK